MQTALEHFAAARLQDLAIVRAYAESLLQQRAISGPSDTQLAALLSTVLLISGVNLVLLLLLPKGRRLVFTTVETILATALIAVLLAVVLGLPLGIIYLILKALAFLLNLLFSIPALANIVESLRSSSM